MEESFKRDGWVVFGLTTPNDTIGIACKAIVNGSPQIDRRNEGAPSENNAVPQLSYRMSGQTRVA